jgi:hypothetical protein
MRVLIGTVLSIPFLPFSSMILTFIYMIIVSLYGMAQTHGTSIYVEQIDDFLLNSLPKNKISQNPSTSQNSIVANLSSIDRIKKTIQDAALFLPISLILIISAIQFSFFCARYSILLVHTYCFNRFQRNNVYLPV